MTIKELRTLIDGMEDETEVCITIDDNTFVKTCICSSGLDEIEFNEKAEIVLVLSPCEEEIIDMIIDDAENQLYQISEN